jgi:hypothetical protein
MHQREVNGVPEVASGVRTAGQVMHSVSRSRFHHFPRY